MRSYPLVRLISLINPLSNSFRFLLLSFFSIFALLALWWLAPTIATFTRLGRLREFFEHQSERSAWLINAGARCGSAPFMWPSTGYLGFGYGDSWSIGHRHTGLDIFAASGLNQTPIYAAHPGYLTRLPDWKSTVIIRIPQDPLEPTRQIWAYYTHMAGPGGDSYISPEFPPGTNEKFVEAGTLLGYQGNYSGDPANPVGIHLHFSIVKDDGTGQFLNETRMENTLDPSPYFGIKAGVFDDWTEPITCDK